MPKNPIDSVLLRYLLILGLALSAELLYKIIYYLTVYPVFFILKQFYEVYLKDQLLIVGSLEIGLVDACLAGSAYLLLFILNLSTPMSIKQRAYSFSICFLALLLFNILRISVFAALFIRGSVYFELFHLLFWYFISTLLVVGVWLFAVRQLKIKEIPFYSDIVQILALRKEFH